MQNSSTMKRFVSMAMAVLLVLSLGTACKKKSKGGTTSKSPTPAAQTTSP